MLNKLYKKITRQEKILKSFQKALAEDSLNFELHLEYAKYSYSIKNYSLALAELRTSITLGLKHDVEKLLNELECRLPPKENLDHNTFYRMTSLTNEVNDLRLGSDISVLDIGGGIGLLAQFLPETSYCLAEPTVNGISGTNLPFKDNTFDVVVACHVLEHIPVEQREIFLNNLIAKAKKAVVLLNPFSVEGTSIEERLKLCIDITNADWAKEHLNCTLPKLDLIHKFAEKNRLAYSIKANGTLTTSLAMIFVDHFAKKRGRQSDLVKINRFFNQKLTSILDSEKYPNSYLIVFDIQQERGI